MYRRGHPKGNKQIKKCGTSLPIKAIEMENETIILSRSQGLLKGTGAHSQWTQEVQTWIKVCKLYDPAYFQWNHHTGTKRTSSLLISDWMWKHTCISEELNCGLKQQVNIDTKPGMHFWNKFTEWITEYYPCSNLHAMKYLTYKSTHYFRNEDIIDYSKNVLNAYHPRASTTKRNPKHQQVPTKLQKMQRKGEKKLIEETLT